MPTRSEPWPTGTPCWVDLAVPDVSAATAFYGAVLGWSATDTGEQYGGYQMCSRDGHLTGGIGPVQGEGQPAVWTVYLASDDVDGTAKAISESGGAVIMPPMDVHVAGRMCIAQDTQGAVFGVWQAGETHGVGLYNEPGGLVWTDARLTDPDAGLQFYADVFGYTYQPVEGAPEDYATFHLGGDPLGGMGGMMGAPAGTPSHWVAYFSVADADAAVAAARDGGAQLLAEPWDTPYGRMAFITDPQGAAFAVIGPMAAS